MISVKFCLFIIPLLFHLPDLYILILYCEKSGNKIFACFKINKYITHQDLNSVDGWSIGGKKSVIIKLRRRLILKLFLVRFLG